MKYDLHEFWESIGNRISMAQNMPMFKDAFLKHKADKSGGHTYELVYSSLFSDLTQVNNVCELGIYHGASLRAWKELFPNAHVTGLDRDVNFFIHEDRISSFYMDQTVNSSIDDIVSVFGTTKFDLFVDDASHIFELSLVCFERLKTLVSGFYVIEDIKNDDLQKWKDLNIANSSIVEMHDLRPWLNDNNMLIVKL